VLGREPPPGSHLQSQSAIGRTKADIMTLKNKGHSCFARQFPAP
jgi:hypothetical protein